MINRILLYNSGGGLGDSIQLYPLIISLKKYFKESDFYYLGAHENYYQSKLKDYNISVKTLDLDLKYFGFRWWHYFKVKKQFSKLNVNKFDLVIDLQTKIRNTLILKKIPTENFYSATYKFSFCSIKNNYSFKKNICTMTLDNIEKFLNIKIERIKYDLKNINEIFFKEAKRLLPNNNYIGFSITQGNIYRKKSWSLDNFISLAKEIKILNKVPVFFLEKSSEEVANKIKLEIPEALIPEYESNLSGPALVTALSSRLEKAISIDNGIMHMISLSKIPMIILFGPTDSEKFSPDEKNIIILDTKKIYKSDDILKIQITDILKYIN